MELRGLLPHWPPAVWLTVGLFCLFFLVLRRTYDLWRIQRDELTVFRTKAAPEFVIDFAKEGDEVVGFMLRNTSSQNLYNLAVVNIRSRVGEVGWWENFFTCFEARVGEIVLIPSSRIGSPIMFQDVQALKKALVETPGGNNPESVGLLEIYADEGAGAGVRGAGECRAGERLVTGVGAAGAR